MSPFHNRPPIAFEPLTLGSGDIEAVDYIPRVPGFSPGFSSGQMRPPTPHRIPAPSPSLAPVAMNAMRGPADSTGPNHASVEPLVVRSRPSMKVGFSIVMAGIVLGGILGITTRTQPTIAAYAPSVETVLGATAREEAPLTPSKVEPAATKDTSADNAGTTADEPKETTKTGAKKKRAGSAIVRTTVATTTQAPPKATKEKPEKASRDDDDGYRVASADPSAEREPAKPAKASKKAAKVQDDDDDAPPPPKAARSKPKASDDAASVLKAAMGATENTL